MKKLLLTVGLAGVLSSSLVASEEVGSSKIFDRGSFDFALGKATLEDEGSTSLGFDFRGEKEVFVKNLYVGLGMGADFFKPNSNLLVFTANFYPVISYDITKGLNVNTSFGYTAGQIMFKQDSYNGGAYYGSDDSVSVSGSYFGLGLSYDIASKYKVGIDYKKGNLKADGTEKSDFSRANLTFGFRF